MIKERNVINAKKSVGGIIVLALFLALSGCEEKPYCKLKYGGMSPGGRYPEKASDEEYLYTIRVDASRERSGSFYDYQKKLFRLTIKSVGGNILARDCIAVSAAHFDVRFNWHSDEVVDVVIDYDDKVGASRTLISRYVRTADGPKFISQPWSAEQAKPTP